MEEDIIQFEELKPRAPKVIVYGVQGIGKTSLGKDAPKPLFIRAEDGLIVKNGEDVKALPMLKSYNDLVKQLTFVYKENHGRETLVIDSLDRIEPLIHAQIAFENKVKNIAEIPYGRGYELAMGLWRDFIDMIDAINRTRNMTIVMIAHAKVQNYANPETESYDRYTIRLHESSSGKTSAARFLIEDADIVMFANYFVGVSSVDNGTRNKGVGSSSDRILYTEERPVAIAKNRFDLPETIPFDKDGKYWSIIKQNVPFFNTQEV